MTDPEQNKSSPAQPPESLLQAVRHLLKPLIKLLIRHGITLPMLNEILKRTYVEVADSDFRLEPEAPPSDSRISLLTRVHRKDVRRLREQQPEDSAPLSTTSLGAQIVAQWTGSPDYTDKSGAPLALHRSGTDGPSFEALVTSLSKDVRPRVVLDELLRQHLVVMEGDLIRLNQSAFLPRDDFDQLMVHFSRNLHDHLATAEQNVAGERQSLPERSVYYTGLSATSVKKLAKLAEEKGMQAILEVNREASALSEADGGQPGADHRITFGIYVHTADEEQPQ